MPPAATEKAAITATIKTAAASFVTARLDATKRNVFFRLFFNFKNSFIV